MREGGAKWSLLWGRGERGGKLRSIEIAVEEVGEPDGTRSDDGRGC